MPTQPNSQPIISQTEDAHTRLDVRLKDETVWLSQKLKSDQRDLDALVNLISDYNTGCKR